jgi:hypothetical protein
MLGLSLDASSTHRFAVLIHPGIASDAAPTPIAFKNSRRFTPLAIFEFSVNVFVLKFDFPNHIV